MDGRGIISWALSASESTLWWRSKIQIQRSIGNNSSLIPKASPIKWHPDATLVTLLDLLLTTLAYDIITTTNLHLVYLTYEFCSHTNLLTNSLTYLRLKVWEVVPPGAAGRKSRDCAKCDHTLRLCNKFVYDASGSDSGRKCAWKELQLTKSPASESRMCSFLFYFDYVCSATHVP